MANTIPVSRIFRDFVLVFALCGAACGGQTDALAVEKEPVTGDDKLPPRVGGCDLFPIEDAWNTPIDSAPVDKEYTARFARNMKAVKLHPDFGKNLAGDEQYGIPFNVVPERQPGVDVEFMYDPNDPGPYPFPGPETVRIEGNDPTQEPENGHLIVLQQGTCLLAEAWGCQFDDGWICGLGAKFKLDELSDAQRKKRTTSAGASGMPILAGLVRREEAMTGEIRHALRFTARCLSDGFIAPAVNAQESGECDDDDRLPMGLRARLRADFDTSALKGTARAVAEALKTYGMILSANGGDLYLQGEYEPRWDNENFAALRRIPGSAFEVVGPVMPEL